MNIKEKILRRVGEKIENNDWSNPEIIDIIEEKDFYLAYGVEAYNNFKQNYKPNPKELQDALKEIEAIPRIANAEQIRGILSNKKYSFSKNNELIDLLDTLIVYLDENGWKRTTLNRYEPRKRNISPSMVRQHHWYKQLIKHKLNDGARLSPVVLNSIKYITNPSDNLSIVGDDAKKKVAQNVFGSENQNKPLVEQVKDMFAPYKEILNNEENYTIFCSRLFYEKDIKKIWDWDPEHPLIQPESETDHSLNQILYGPPGTGKTRKTARTAVEIITGKEFSDEQKDRRKILETYHKAVKTRQIDFVTFHQSYGYEEFVEGIKPKLDGEDNTEIEYHVKPGIFRQICDRAKKVQASDSSLEKDSTSTEIDIPKNVWAVRLGRPEYKVGEWDAEIQQNCFNGNYIAVGSNNTKFWEIKTGDLIIVPAHSPGKTMKFCAAGRVTGEVTDDSQIDDFLRRKTEWIWQARSEEEWENLRDYGATKSFTRHTLQLHSKGDINVKKLLHALQKTRPSKESSNKPRYVLIIDEINRGNISKILGELITLLEDDKRAGSKEQLTVTLPYSNEAFSIPNNLYIIGTMNTADRSIAFLDTALRRRFEFKEMMPMYNLPEISTDVGGVNLQLLLEAINKRICEELDRDHQIGHSYFLGVGNVKDLAKVFRNKICPLLDEYFHDQPKSIIAKVLNDSPLFALKDGSDKNGEWTEDEKEFETPGNYTVIYDDNLSEQ